MRMRPKMSEKPDDSRKSSAPSARLFRVWMIQNCIGARSAQDSRFFAGGQSREYTGFLRNSSGG